MSTTTISEIWIDKNDLSSTKLSRVDVDLNRMADNQVMLEVESFGFSANNITYAVFGDKMGYWGFFPAAEGWGKVPIWGFAKVTHSRHPDIQVGEKVFGYLPMASHLLITAGKVTQQGFFDVDERRKSISPVYDSYVRCATDPGYHADKEDWQLNYRPLFMTSFVLDDYVGDNLSSDTKTVILTSASSKTAYGAGFLLKHLKQERGASYKVVGMTSAANVEFTEKSACYDQVVSYDSLEQLDLNGEVWVLDFAGNKELLLNIQKSNPEQPAKLVFIGATDVEAQTDKPEGNLDGELFFAPSQVKKRTQEWGPQGFGMKYAQAWQAFSKHIEDLVETKEYEGAKAIAQLYVEGLNGHFKTDEMIVARF